MELHLNTGKDFKGDMVEMIVSGDEGAYICAHSVRSSIYFMQAGNEMTESRILNSLFALENFKKLVDITFLFIIDGLIKSSKFH